MRKSLLLASVFSLIPVLASATEYYVAKTGNDANTCVQAQSLATPKLTIAAGMTCWSLGDTIWVGSGVYTEAGLGPSFIAGTSTTNRVALRALVPGGVTIRPTTTGQAVLISAKPYVHLDGLIIDAINAGNDALKLQSNSHHILIERTRLTNSQTQGLLCQQSPNGIFRNSRSDHNGNLSVNGHLWHGVYLNTGCDDWEFDRPELDHNAQMGIQFYSSPKRANFHHGFVHHNCQKVGNGGSEMIVAHQDHVISDTIVWSEGDCGSGITINLSSPARSRLTNDTVICTGSCSGNGINITASNTGVTVENVIALGWNSNLTNNGVDSTLTTNRTSGTISAIFKDAANGDFAQIAGAVTIDAGTTTGASFCGASIDQGVHEVCGPSSASIDGRTLDLTLSTAHAPWQLTSGATGWSVSCTGTGCGTPVINNTAVITGAPGLIRFDLSGITGNACAAGQTWTVSHNSTTGTAEDSVNIGGSKNQDLLTFSNFSVTNNCAVGGGGGGGTAPTYPGTPYALYRFDGNANDSSGNGRNGTATGTSYVSGKYDQGVKADLGESDYVQLPFGGSVDPSATSITAAIGFWIDPSDLGNTRAIMGTTLSGSTRMYVLRQSGTFRLGVQSFAASQASALAEQSGWNHVCITFNAATDTATLWGNGVQGASAGAVQSYTSFTTAGNWRVGLPENFATTSASGHIYDEAVFYQGSVEDCAAIYAAWEPDTSPWTGTITAVATRPYQVKVNSALTRIPLAANNTCVTIPMYGAFAGVWQIDGTAADPSPIGFGAYYSCASCPSAGSILPVPNTANADGIRFYNASESGLISGSHGAALSGALTLAGGATHMTSSSVQVVDMAQNNSTLQSYGFQFDGAVEGREYRFRLREQSGLDLNNHTTAGELCVIAGPASSGAGF